MENIDHRGNLLHGRREIYQVQLTNAGETVPVSQTLRPDSDFTEKESKRQRKNRSHHGMICNLLTTRVRGTKETTKQGS